MKGYSKVIWILGAIILFVVIALILALALNKNYKALKEKPVPQPEVPVVPILPGLAWMRFKKGNVRVLMLIMLAIIIIAILAGLLLNYKKHGEEIANVSIHEPESQIKCVKECIDAEDYQSCIQECG